MARLTPEQRRELARACAAARWRKPAKPENKPNATEADRPDEREIASEPDGPEPAQPEDRDASLRVLPQPQPQFTEPDKFWTPPELTPQRMRAIDVSDRRRFGKCGGGWDRY